jgi:hypothetical protein
LPSLGAALLCVAGVVAGCSSPSKAPTNTPLLQPGSGTSSERAALLTTSEVLAIPGAPSDAVVTPGQRNVLFEDPDPRAPCGARVTIPDLSQGVDIQIASSSLVGVQIVVDMPETDAAAFVTAWEGNSRTGCPPYVSQTNTGVSQINELTALIPMPDLVDQATGAWITVNSRGQTANTYGMILRSGGRLELDVLIAPQPLSMTFVVGFARAAESALKSSPGST